MSNGTKARKRMCNSTIKSGITQAKYDRIHRAYTINTNHFTTTEIHPIVETKPTIYLPELSNLTQILNFKILWYISKFTAQLMCILTIQGTSFSNQRFLNLSMAIW